MKNGLTRSQPILHSSFEIRNSSLNLHCSAPAHRSGSVTSTSPPMEGNDQSPVFHDRPPPGGEWGLVASAVFKTVVPARKRRRVGSIPTRLRQSLPDLPDQIDDDGDIRDERPDAKH